MDQVASRVLWLHRGRPASITLAVDDVRGDYERRFGANLAYLRVSEGISSQPKLAELVGVSVSTVQRWESGANLPDAWELRRLCEILHVDLDALVDPEPLSDRERLLIRRAARATRAGLGRARRAR